MSRPLRSLLLGYALSALLALAALWPHTLTLLSGPVPTTPVWSADDTLFKGATK